MMAFDDELRHVREKVLSQVSELEGYEFKSKLEEYVYNDECGCYVNINAPFEIVDECHYKLEEDDEDYEEFGLKRAVNQYQNGGYTGDDYAGAIYILLPKSGKFFKYHYHC